MKVGVDDFLVAGGDLDRLLADAEPWVPEPDAPKARRKAKGARRVQRPPKQEQPALDSSDGFRLRPLTGVRSRNTAWLVEGTIPLRAPTMLAGIGGLGKSQYALRIAAQLSTGDLPCGVGDTIVISYEDLPEDQIRPRALAAGGDLDRIHLFEVDDDIARLPQHLPDIGRLAASVDARLVIIDPFIAGVEGDYDAHRDQDIRAVLAEVARLCEENSLSALLVNHLNKTPSKIAYERVGSSGGFWNAVRSVVLLVADPDNEDMLLIAQAKANWSRRRPVERHRVETVVLNEKDEETGLPIVTSRIVFVEVADDVNADDVLGPQRATKKESAGTWLAEALSDGEWREVAPLVAAAEAVGYSRTTLERASSDLGIEKAKAKEFQGPWRWRLP